MRRHKLGWQEKAVEDGKRWWQKDWAREMFAVLGMLIAAAAFAVSVLQFNEIWGRL